MIDPETNVDVSSKLVELEFFKYKATVAICGGVILIWIAQLFTLIRDIDYFFDSTNTYTTLMALFLLYIPVFAFYGIIMATKKYRRYLFRYGN